MTQNPTTTTRTEHTTHYTHSDEPVSRYGWMSAVCGARVNEHFGTDVDLQNPSCERCRAWLNERNHFDDPPAKYSREWLRERLGVSGDRDE